MLSKLMLVIQSALLHLHVYKICMNSVDLKMLLSYVLKYVLYYNVTQNYRELYCSFPILSFHQCFCIFFP